MHRSVKMELLKDALGWLKTILFAFIFAWLLTNFVIVNALVPTGSMQETIRVNDRIVAFRLSYLFSEPQRSDIIVFRSRDYVSVSFLQRITSTFSNRIGDGQTLYVKRIIGVPGDTIYIYDWRVFLNGAEEPLIEDYVLAPGRPGHQHRMFPILESYPLNSYITVPEDGSSPFVTVPDGHFFVLGDHRNNSVDSRSWGAADTLRTFVPQEHIQGRVIFRYFPGFRNLTR